MTPDHTPGDGELLAEALERVQWSAEDEWRYPSCPDCGNNQRIGHDKDCSILIALTAWNRRAPTTPGGENSPSNASLRPTPKSADTEAEPSGPRSYGASTNGGE